MTREEANKILENWGLCHYTPSREAAEAVISALDPLEIISALRPVSQEKVEKMWKGEWKRRNTKNGVEWFCSKCGYVSSPKIQYRDFIPFPENRPMLFCNACGAPLTDEAVQMVMERMEKMNGESE